MRRIRGLTQRIMNYIDLVIVLDLGVLDFGGVTKNSVVEDELVFGKRSFGFIKELFKGDSLDFKASLAEADIQ